MKRIICPRASGNTKCRGSLAGMAVYRDVSLNRSAVESLLPSVCALLCRLVAGSCGVDPVPELGFTVKKVELNFTILDCGEKI